MPRYRIVKEIKADGDLVYKVEELKHYGASQSWDYVSNSVSTNLAVVQVIFKNLLAGIVNKKEVLDEGGTSDV